MNRSTEYGEDAESRRSSAYRRLRDRIVEGQLSPGHRLVEEELAERLGVSRTPIRSALQRLEQEGYAESKSEDGRSRLVVAALTKDDAVELLYLVGALEGLAARACAELNVDERMLVVENLWQVNRQLAKLDEEKRPDRRVWLRLDTNFHDRYVKAAGGPRLRRLHDSIKRQAERYIRVYVAVHRYGIQSSIEEHRAIIAAIEAGEADWAQQAVENNWRNAAGRLCQDIEEIGEFGGW